MLTDRIPLTHVPLEVRRAGGPALTYRHAYLMALDCKIPAERGSDGRWTVAREDLPTVIAACAPAQRAAA